MREQFMDGKSNFTASKKKKKRRKRAKAKHRNESKQILNIAEKIVADINPNRY